MRHPYREVYQAKPKIGSNPGEFTAAQVKTTGVDEFLYHAIHLENDGQARLALDNERIDGFFLNFDGINSWEDNVMLLFVFQDRGVSARNGTANPINVGEKLVGAQRSSVPEGKTQYGYVKPVSPLLAVGSGPTKPEIEASLARLRDARGRVQEPLGGAHAVNDTTYPPADVIVRWGFE